MRVATHDASDDADVLRIHTPEALFYADAVDSTRDMLFNEAKEYAFSSGLPGTEYARLWRDKERMRRLARSTQNLGAVWWHERDRHLQDISCTVRLRSIRRRLDAFRSYADSLAKRYRVITLEDMPMIDWVGKGKTAALERLRSIASLSLLQNIIAERFGVERVDWVPAAHTSMVCSSCKVQRELTVGPGPHWVCAACGHEHHQDYNAAANLRLLSEQWIADGKSLRARKRKSKKGNDKKHVNAIATGDALGMTVTARKSIATAA
jgi:transposase